MSDEAIRTTNDDATGCKKSAVERGYWQDPYIKFFSRSTERKAPEINRGYYARVAGVQGLLRQFLKATKCECQIVNLGSGFDTLFWLLQKQGLTPRKFIELDFRDVTSRKCYYIKSRKQLLDVIQPKEGEIRLNAESIHSDVYHLIPCDLRQISDVEAAIKSCDCDVTIPTVFLAECVLVYMPAQASSTLLRSISSTFTSVFFINYEQVRMQDRFGEVMVQNLQTRNCVLAGIESCASLETQEQRFTSTGWESAHALDMNAVYANLPPADVTRIEQLEFLDEREMLQQLFDHYCICYAYKDSQNKHGLKDINFENLAKT